MKITGQTVYSVGEKYEFLNYRFLFKNWECAKIRLRQKVSSPESAKICLRQNFSFYSIDLKFGEKKSS